MIPTISVSAVVVQGDEPAVPAHVVADGEAPGHAVPVLRASGLFERARDTESMFAGEEAAPERVPGGACTEVDNRQPFEPDFAEIYASNFIAHGQAMRDMFDMADGSKIPFGYLPSVVQLEIERQVGGQILDGEEVTICQRKGDRVDVLVPSPKEVDGGAPSGVRP